jgi:HSP20 family protein
MGSASTAGGFAPSFDVRETKDAYVFTADLPGVKEGDLELSLTGNRLTLSGRREEEKREEEDRWFAYERSYGSFSRSFTLPEGVDPDHVQAELKDGVLRVSVPKKAEVKPRKIELKQIGSSKAKA